jgi:predicted peroxiredoxin
MKAKTVIQVACLTFVLAALTGVAKAVAEQPRDGVFIHVSHGGEDPHRVLMALNMASIMSEDRDVLVYFDIKGIEVVLKGGDDLTYSHFPSSKTQLAALPRKGVILMACPGCLKAAGKTAADLASGVQIADKDRFFSFTKGRILTLDY